MTSTENLFCFEQIEVNSEVDTTLIFEEISKELEEYLLEKNVNTNWTEGVFDFLELLINRVQEDFDELIGKTLTKNILSKLSQVYLHCHLTQKSRLPTRSKEYLKWQLKRCWKYVKS